MYQKKDGAFSPVQGKNDKTTLLQMQQYVEGLGLNCSAVKTDIKTLSSYASSVLPSRTGALSETGPLTESCQVILHLPRQNHFVVLGDINKRFVRLIDLSDNRFYYRQGIDDFKSDWDGTALVVTKKSVALDGSFAKIAKANLNKIIGTGCSQCNTSCSSSGDSPCNGSPPTCGTHTIRYSRTCCGSAASGSCSEGSLVYKKKETCDLDGYFNCVGQEDWNSYTMQACG